MLTTWTGVQYFFIIDQEIADCSCHIVVPIRMRTIPYTLRHFYGLFVKKFENRKKQGLLYRHWKQTKSCLSLSVQYKGYEWRIKNSWFYWHINTQVSYYQSMFLVKSWSSHLSFHLRPLPYQTNLMINSAKNEWWITMTRSKPKIKTFSTCKKTTLI